MAMTKYLLSGSGALRLSACFGALAGLACSVLLACSSLGPSAPADDEVLDGPLSDLTGEQLSRHIRGDVAFNDEIFTAETGLGPTFVATSCGSCHAGDGKGHPFTSLVRFGQVDSTGNQYLHAGGPQLQNRALPAHEPEQLPAGATFATFLPPSVTGLGFLEAVPDSTLLALADPFDSDGDGISGVPNWTDLPSYVTPRPGAVTSNGKYLSRFGKKASVHNLLIQTVNAYSEDIGIASAFAPVDVYSGDEIDPEVDNATISDVVFYLQTLKAPIPRDVDDAEVRQGRTHFDQIGCAGCHVPTLRTGYSPIEALSNQEIHPYTDLLLHDMGPGLDDGYTEGSAATYEWRTPPLWGLGLAPNSQGGAYFLLHDGRAPGIEEAIRLHGGEADSSRLRFEALPEASRQALIRFLESL